MKTSVKLSPTNNDGTLLDKIAHLLETVRKQVSRSVNHETATAYWLIGRRIVQSLQEGESRAAYGKALFVALAERLIERYWQEFSVTNLKYFKKFYLAYPIRHPVDGECARALIENQIK